MNVLDPHDKANNQANSFCVWGAIAPFCLIFLSELENVTHASKPGHFCPIGTQGGLFLPRLFLPFRRLFACDFLRFQSFFGGISRQFFGLHVKQVPAFQGFYDTFLDAAAILPRRKPNSAPGAGRYDLLSPLVQLRVFA